MKPARDESMDVCKVFDDCVRTLTRDGINADSPMFGAELAEMLCAAAILRWVRARDVAGHWLPRPKLIAMMCDPKHGYAIVCGAKARLQLTVATHRPQHLGDLSHLPMQAALRQAEPLLTTAASLLEMAATMKRVGSSGMPPTGLFLRVVND